MKIGPSPLSNEAVMGGKTGLIAIFPKFAGY
jgi:hypothetical protein